MNDPEDGLEDDARKVPRRVVFAYAKRAMKTRGHAVIGYRTDMGYEPGELVPDFGGGELPGDWYLAIKARTDRADYDEQHIELFGCPPAEQGGCYYRAELYHDKGDSRYLRVEGTDEFRHVIENSPAHLKLKAEWESRQPQPDAARQEGA